MKKFSTIIVLCIVAAISLTVDCLAQEGNKTERRKVAIGINLGGDFLSSMIGLSSEGSFLTPFKLQLVFVNEKFRFEPNFGFAKTKYTNIFFGEPDQIIASVLNIGTGLMYQVPRNKSDFYMGLRVDFINMDSGINTSHGFNIAPVLGVEYYFNPHLSLGAEVDANFLSLSTDSSDNQLSSFNFENKIMLRFYL